MFSFLLAIIYIAFISLGLPDSLLGSAWPVMYIQLDAPLSYAGIISMVITCGTVVSSLMTDKLTARLGTGRVTAISVAMTAAALFGFSVSDSLVQIFLWSLPYGLGAGAVDAALNNYVALHFAARHMSWLHCFWGVGASVSPYIMSMALESRFGWRGGYGIISLLQVVLSIVLFCTLPLWKLKNGHTAQQAAARPLSIPQALGIKGVKPVLIGFFCYCAMETTAGLWASSYLVDHRGIDTTTAAMFASLFYLGITFGRFVCGFAAEKLGDRTCIRCGAAITLLGIALVGIPFSSDIFALAGLVIIGLGCAPVYPSLIHCTPDSFGQENSLSIVGLQMATAYCGSSLMPTAFGVVARYVSIGLYPLYMCIFCVLMLITTESCFCAVAKSKNTLSARA